MIHRFHWTAQSEILDAALRHLGDALTHWKQYAAVRDAHYVPALYNRVGYVDITALTDQVTADLDIARTWKPGTLKDDGKRSGTEKRLPQLNRAVLLKSDLALWTAAACCRFPFRSLLRNNLARSLGSRLPSQKRQQAAAVQVGQKNS